MNGEFSLEDLCGSAPNMAPRYIRHTCVQQAIGVLLATGQIHCADQLKQLDDVFQEVERATGWGANTPAQTLRRVLDMAGRFDD